MAAEVASSGKAKDGEFRKKEEEDESSDRCVERKLKSFVNSLIISFKYVYAVFF